MGTMTHDQAEKPKQPLKPNRDVHDQDQHDARAGAVIALNAPGTLVPKQVLALQRTAGNRAVQRMIERVPRAEEGSNTVVQGRFNPARLADETRDSVDIYEGREREYQTVRLMVSNDRGEFAESELEGTEGGRVRVTRSY